VKRFGVYSVDLGIVRLANVTGLDYLGIPVFMAVRPNSRSLSVSQGKGLDDWAAKASAFMEAAELAHAERIGGRLRVMSYAAMKSRAADPASLPLAKGRKLRRDCEIPWIEGRDIAGGNSIFVPFELVHTDYTLPQRAGMGFFAASSNGLASGNHKLEAICAGLCEVVERDATALWRLRAHEDRARRRLKLSTVGDGDCRWLLDRLTDCGIAVAAWDATTDVGIACLVCRIRESPANKRSNHGAFWGAGCHVSSAIALIRALTEAVQSRLTYIAGSRDDLRRRDYGDARNAALYDLALDLWEGQRAARVFGDVPSVTHATVARDVSHILAKLRCVGLDEGVVVDLSRPRLGIPVVRVIVPGLEADHENGRRGCRARAFARSLQ